MIDFQLKYVSLREIHFIFCCMLHLRFSKNKFSSASKFLDLYFVTLIFFWYGLKYWASFYKIFRWNIDKFIVFKKKKGNSYSKTNYRREIKLVPIMDYKLLQFVALKFFIGVCLHGGSLNLTNFFKRKPPNFSMKSWRSPIKFPINKFSQHF